MKTDTKQNIYTLLELQTRIKDGLRSLFSDIYQVVAEINEIKVNSSGHCYIELVQHNENSAVPQAKAGATIWAYTYRMLKPYFESETGRSLEAGMKVLLSVQVQYHEVYGLSLNVVDIDPTYTVGEIEMQRQRTIQRLIDDGVFDINKSLDLPLLPLRVAVVSSATAAGYRDFMNQLYRNGYNYNFATTLFAATMQGGGADASIIAAITKMNEKIDDFDVLVIIRGGGSISDLSCFDSYELAYNVAQVPIPVITGIGHDKDVSVVDMVAHTMMKTPTAAAEFLVDCVAEQENCIDNFATQLSDAVNEHLQNKQFELQSLSANMKHAAQKKLERGKIYVDSFLAQRLKPLLAARFKELNLKLNLCEKDISSHNPHIILQRGYSVVMRGDKVLTSANAVQATDEVQIIFNEGRKNAIIK